VDVTAIARLRDRAKASFEAREGTKLSFLPFFAVAVCEALKQHPVLNASVTGDQITYHNAEHLGIASLVMLLSWLVGMGVNRWLGV
jgi:2-oxoglutarate dehydrogenase E2 component (dihydrolipoamide succinyltransferase)